MIVNDAPNQDGNLTYTTPENLAVYDNWVFELNFPIEFGKKITGFGGNQFIYNRYRADYLGSRFNQSKWNWLAYWQVAYKPTDTWSFEISGYYMTKSLQEFINLERLGSFDFGIQKSFWNNKGRVTFNISDMFFSERSTGRIKYEAIDVKFRQLEDSRNIRLSFRYSFGNQKLKAARNRNTAADAEENRVKTN